MSTVFSDSVFPRWLSFGRILDLIYNTSRADGRGHVAPYVPRIPEMTVLD